MYLKLLVFSLHFNSRKAEEPVAAFMIEEDRNSGFKTYFSSLPSMKPSYMDMLQKNVESYEMTKEVLPNGEN